MFSYLQSIQPIVDSGIYNRGVRLYLEGKVIGYINLIIDNWRQYSVSGKEQYTVKTPLLHLSLSRSKYDQAPEAIKQIATCTCDYFDQEGTCKHIVAVMASLEHEFNPKVHTHDIQHIDSVLSTIFEVETDKKIRTTLHEFERLAYTGIKYEDEITKKLVHLPELILQHNPEVIAALQHNITTIIGNYTQEKTLVQIIAHSLFISQTGDTWLEFWLPYTSKLDRINYLKLVELLWKNYLIGSFKQNQKSIQQFFAGLDDATKAEVLESLQKQFTRHTTDWLDFCFVAQYKTWIIGNIDKLDPQYLIDAIPIYPEMREEIEITLSNTIKTWVNFLPSGDYTELITVLKKWVKTIGKSEIFEETLTYIKQNHPRKSSLLAAIETL